MRLPLLLALVVADVAFAHAALTSPTPRSSDSAIKTGPCGQYAKLNNPTPVLAGAPLTVTWEETVQHPGHYRLAYSLGADTDAEFNQHVLADNIPNPTGLQATNSMDVTMPNINCDNCTLQLVMVMTETNPPTNYYSCADIRLYGSDAGVESDAGSGGGGGGGGATEDAGVEDAGTGGGGGGGGGGVTKPTGTAEAEGGCNAGAMAPMIVAPLLLAFAIRRRRARYTS
ncbi:MAG: SCE4755 family polysaccharide monooxygenase-like protein [Myxococcaceae bacterium]